MLIKLSLGTESQKMHLARLLANQMTLAGLGGKDSESSRSERSEKRKRSSSRSESRSKSTRSSQLSLKSEPMSDLPAPPKRREAIPDKTAQKKKRQEFQLESVTCELSRDEKFDLVEQAAMNLGQFNTVRDDYNEVFLPKMSVPYIHSQL